MDLYQFLSRDVLVVVLVLIFARKRLSLLTLIPSSDASIEGKCIEQECFTSNLLDDFNYFPNDWQSYIVKISIFPHMNFYHYPIPLLDVSDFDKLSEEYKFIFQRVEFRNI